jgi:hypothetical protein
LACSIEKVVFNVTKPLGPKKVSKKSVVKGTILDSEFKSASTYASVTLA